MFSPIYTCLKLTTKRTKHGAVISQRDPPDFGSTYSNISALPKEMREGLNKILIVAGDLKRQLFSATHPTLRKRRLNGSLTQVLGGLYSGHIEEWHSVETSIVDQVLQAAATYRTQIIRDMKAQETQKLLSAVDSIIEVLKSAIVKTVQQYLNRLLGLLPQSRFLLEWTMTSNNCQVFCDNLLKDFWKVFSLVKYKCSSLSSQLYCSFSHLVLRHICDISA